jgi:hypothetical protein
LILLKSFGYKINYLVQDEDRVICDNEVFILENGKELNSIQRLPLKFSSCAVVQP